ncbi:MAG TPA: SPOR domain-containing protein [Bacteroidales bacterium]|nr:SPOR domain-containing protein [Bacteroidales bacterium]HPS63099.1 SPOR domain-containing protein [Bacteroidales bacterium]
MDIHPYITDLLTRHDCVIIPGFGGFIGNRAPAWVDPLRHVFHPPYKKLIFNVHLKQNDGLLAHAIAGASGTSYEDACRLIEAWADRCRFLLGAGDPVVIPGIGQLLPGPEGIIFFEQEPDSSLLPESFGLTPFVSPPVSRLTSLAANKEEATAHNEKSGRTIALRQTLRWAAALAFPVGVAAIVGLSRFGPLSSPAESRAGILGPVFARFSTAALVERKVAPVVHALPAAPKPVVTSQKPVETPVQPMAREQETGRFAIIVGAFRYRENADRLVDELNRKGMGAAIFDQSKTGLFRVSFGTAPDREKALELLASAKSMSFPGAWILSK